MNLRRCFFYFRCDVMCGYLIVELYVWGVSEVVALRWDQGGRYSCCTTPPPDPGANKSRKSMFIHWIMLTPNPHRYILVATSSVQILGVPLRISEDSGRLAMNL